MELDQKELEIIRDAVRNVEYGSVKINISETSENLEIEIHKRIRIKRTSKTQRTPDGNIIYTLPNVSRK